VLNAYLSSTPVKHGIHNVGRILRGGRRRASLYYRADDPYSHLLAQIAPRLKRVYGFSIEIVPVAQPGLSANPAPDMLREHAIRDAGILAESYGLSFPIGATAPAEDRVRRAHSVLLEPRSPDEQVALAIALGEAVWRDDGQTLGAIVARHGGVSGESVNPALEANYLALERAGHYQPGMLQYGGDWYWGIDRLCHLESRLASEGLEGSLELSAGPSPHLATLMHGFGEDAPRIEVFVSFRSPYSYVAADSLTRLRDRLDVEIKVRPVLPMVMRGLEVPTAKRLYIAQDAKREADRLGAPFGHVCDPLGKGIGYCMALFFNSVEGQGRAELDFFHSIGKGAWSEARDVAHVPDLVALAERVGIGEAEARAAIEDRSWKGPAKANRDALTEMGLWGVPSLRVGSYTTWGQDRIPLVEAEIERRSRAV
jgi:2-hydroxychromene-2-carboxylate isomerase